MTVMPSILLFFPISSSLAFFFPFILLRTTYIHLRWSFSRFRKLNFRLLGFVKFTLFWEICYSISHFSFPYLMRIILNDILFALSRLSIGHWTHSILTFMEKKLKRNFNAKTNDGRNSFRQLLLFIGMKRSNKHLFKNLFIWRSFLLYCVFNIVHCHCYRTESTIYIS